MGEAPPSPRPCVRTANNIVGIIGAGLGGWLAGQLGMGGGPAMAWAMAVVGAAILIAVRKVIGVFR